MATTTLLDIVQGILSDSDGDEVNNISDTIDSEQCARVVINEFNTIVDNFDIKHHEQNVRLDATGASTPTVMTRPDGFHSIEEVYYDVRNEAGDPVRMRPINYRDPKSFLEFTQNRTSSDSNVDAMTVANGYDVLIRNDQAPQWWTILDGYDDIVFDSYDSALESNLQASKSLARGVQRPTLAFSDTAIPDLPENLMQLLKDRSRAFYFDVYKEGVPRAVDKRERNSEVRSQRKRYITKRLQEERRGGPIGRKRGA